ncbi:MAG: cupin domain-containing protein [Selenomonadaceae bacterium]|nr:cupin domain-containing protein [Selenomonadaceae bacterium]
MALIESNTIKAMNKAGGKGEITITHLLTPAELDGKCLMFAMVTIPPGASLGVHPHNGNTETYHILQGEALYNDNGNEIKIGAGTTTFCPNGEVHGIENIGQDDLIFVALIIKK